MRFIPFYNFSREDVRDLNCLAARDGKSNFSSEFVAVNTRMKHLGYLSPEEMQNEQHCPGMNQLEMSFSLPEMKLIETILFKNNREDLRKKLVYNRDNLCLNVASAVLGLGCSAGGITGVAIGAGGGFSSWCLSFVAGFLLLPGGQLIARFCIDPCMQNALDAVERCIYSPFKSDMEANIAFFRKDNAPSSSDNPLSHAPTTEPFNMV